MTDSIFPDSKYFNPTPFNVRLDVLLTVLPILLLLAIYYIRKDYYAFLALGPGGTPSTPTGYLRICVLRLFAVRNPLAPPSISPSLSPHQGILTPSLSCRNAPRPKVVGIAPHRQITQQGDAAMYQALSEEIQRLVNQHPDTLFTGTSCFEKHSTGIFCNGAGNPNINPQPWSVSVLSSRSRQRRLRFTCNGEVCHSHASDGSLHLTLHPADVKLVLERGWGQRHPLSRESWWWWANIVPPGFVMIYAPRDRAELETVIEIIRAAAWWVSGTELRREDGEVGK